MQVFGIIFGYKIRGYALHLGALVDPDHEGRIQRGSACCKLGGERPQNQEAKKNRLGLTGSEKVFPISNRQEFVEKKRSGKRRNKPQGGTKKSRNRPHEKNKTGMAAQR